MDGTEIDNYFKDTTVCLFIRNYSLKYRTYAYILDGMFKINSNFQKRSIIIVNVNKKYE